MLNNEKGQSLIEILVVLVVAVIMMIALINIILSGLKNAQFAQNQTKATKLAQDAIDKIRVLRDSNKDGTLSPDGSTYGCFNLLWKNDTASAFYCGADTNNYCYYQLNMVSPKLTLVSASHSKQSIEDGFGRQIIVNPSANSADNTEIKLIVRISWNDSSGEHNSNIESVLTKPNYDCIQ